MDHSFLALQQTDNQQEAKAAAAAAFSCPLEYYIFLPWCATAPMANESEKRMGKKCEQISLRSDMSETDQQYSLASDL